MSTVQYRIAISNLLSQFEAEAKKKHALSVEIVSDQSGIPCGLEIRRQGAKDAEWESLALQANCLLDSEDSGYLDSEIAPSMRFLQFVFDLVCQKSVKNGSVISEFPETVGAFEISALALKLLLERLDTNAKEEPFDVDAIVAAARELVKTIRERLPATNQPFPFPIGDRAYIESDWQILGIAMNAAARLDIALNPDHRQRAVADIWHIRSRPLKGGKLSAEAMAGHPVHHPDEHPVRLALQRVWDTFHAHFNEPLIDAGCSRKGNTWKPGRLPSFEEAHLNALETAADELEDSWHRLSTTHDQRSHEGGASGGESQTGKSAADEAPGDSTLGKEGSKLEELNRAIPALDASVDWMTNKQTAKVLGIKTKTLANHRDGGKKRVSQTGSSGLHDDFCFWRKRGQEHPYYYLPLMEENAGHLAKTFPHHSLESTE